MRIARVAALVAVAVTSGGPLSAGQAEVPSSAWRSLAGLRPEVNASQWLAREPSERGTSERVQINWNPQTRGSGDSVLNGTLIGMAVGAATGFLGSAAIYQCSDEPECSPVLAVFTLAGAGVGAVIGLAIDASKSQHRRVGAGPKVRRRVALSALLRKHRQGMAVVLRFDRTNLTERPRAEPLFPCSTHWYGGGGWRWQSFRTRLSPSG
jgi:hypothetical protein